MFQRRASERHQVVIAGKIMSPDLTEFVGCVIKDISDGGARVTVTEGVALPDRVYLWQEQTGTIIECEVRWQQSGTAGLKFAHANAPAVRALTRICTPASRALPLYSPRRSVMMPSPAAATRYLAEAC